VIATAAIIPAGRARNVAVSACALSAGVHAGLVPAHLAESRPLGIAFAISAPALLWVAASLAAADAPRAHAALAAAMRAGLIGAYGRAAGDRLTALLREHILGAVTLLEAAKAGDNAKIASASAAWYANGNQVADFFHDANQRNWPRAVIRSMMKEHLDQTLKEAQDRLTGKFAADVRDYDAIHRHILDMAGTLSAGIMRQFPQRFR
jgi:hypothetical protein